MRTVAVRSLLWLAGALETTGCSIDDRSNNIPLRPQCSARSGIEDIRRENSVWNQKTSLGITHGIIMTIMIVSTVTSLARVYGQLIFEIHGIIGINGINDLRLPPLILHQLRPQIYK